MIEPKAAGRPQPAAAAVRWSAGVNRPRCALPQPATDCHHHLYDDRLAVAPGAFLQPPEATVEDYRALQRRLGLARNVLIQPSTYGTDNRGLVVGLERFGPAYARGIAVVDRHAGEDVLRRLNDAGVCGLRINAIARPADGDHANVVALGRRCADLGWHLEINASADWIAAAAALLRGLPCPVVFDHLGHLPQPRGNGHPAFSIMRGLLDAGRGWIKLTGLYNDSRRGPPRYEDSAAVAAAFAAFAPERAVWGSDWPHPTEPAHAKPNDADLLDLLLEWVPDDAALRRILVTNPALLYGFPLPPENDAFGAGNLPER
ncbi:amidohydrolase family protein [Pigmentiphaga soli]|uniref:Amidohydrolase family protein n=1 Tax=Pigmentiphaga soli TaxID=1007095 RepID=A0ABP8H2U0_9BURK